MAIAVVANAATSSTTIPDSATTSSIDTTGSDMIVVAVVSYDRALSVSDSKSNTWTALTEYGGAAPRTRLFYCVAPSVGSGHTFTVTSTGGFPSVAVIALSGVKQASPFDAENGAAAASPGSVSPSEDNEILITSICFYPSGTLTINSGFTISNQVDYIAGSLMGIGMAYKIQTTAGAENPTWAGISFTERATAIACFKAAGGAFDPATGFPYDQLLVPYFRRTDVVAI